MRDATVNRLILTPSEWAALDRRLRADAAIQLRDQNPEGRSGVGVSTNVRAEVRSAWWGTLLYTARGANLVVDVGRDVIRDHLAGIGYRPDEMAADASSAATTTGMESLTSEIIRKKIDRREKLSHAVEFQAVLGTSEANGTTIRAVSTLERGTLLARALITPTIAKSAAVTVTLAHLFTVFAVEPSS